MKKKKSVIFLMCALLVLSSSTSVFASDDNIKFSLLLKTCSENAYTEARYRQTDSTNNKWKVNFVKSSNINVSSVNFWLAKNSDSSIVSGIQNLTYGSGTKKYKATSDASKTNVKLGAENASYSLRETSTISGYWDEETW